MEERIHQITAFYKDRIKRIALLDPLYDLKRKSGKDRKDNPIDYFGLGLLSLLFFFENMLMRNKKTGVRELANFLYELNQGEMELEEEGYDKVAREILQVFRPTSGKRNYRAFYNWETRQDETVFYSIIKAHQFDSKTNTQYYILDEDGLELIFSTKEYFSELHLSINQLVLRKQLEKGEFVGALRQIDEMRMDVENLYHQINRIKHEIQRNIISDEAYERYKNIVEDIHFRLTRENEEFDELRNFIVKTKDILSKEAHQEKERRAYYLILQIDQELGAVHYEHRKLLEESILLKTTALIAAQESLYYVGIDSFNYHDEITNRLFSSPLPVEASRQLIEPILHLQHSTSWSPMTVFAKQRIEKNQEEKTNTFLQPLSEEELSKMNYIRQQNYKATMEVILKALGEKGSITVEEVVDFVKKENYDAILHQRFFYDFWILLHQKAPIVLSKEEEQQGSLMEAMGLIAKDITTITVVEKEEIVEATDRYTIKNMELRLEAEDHVI
ncbi:MAG: replicative DNA helicase [Clostridiaceae bacterium]|nr:replicative DNA helicase [Clostridiaceae bacterium]